MSAKNHIASRTIATAWEKSILLLLSQYSTKRKTIPTETGSNSIEIQNMVLEIANPMGEKRLSDLYRRWEFMETYKKELFDQDYFAQVYSRITQLKTKGKIVVNQQQSVISRLAENWYSRRGVIGIWNPPEDLVNERPPCVCSLHYYIREEKLCLTSFYRSNDAWLFAPLDMIAITDMQKEVAKELKKTVGSYTHFAVSYHIYDYDIPAAREAFKGRL